MAQPDTTSDRQTPCGKDCDACRDAQITGTQTCEALAPALARLAPEAAGPVEGASWK